MNCYVIWWFYKALKDKSIGRDLLTSTVSKEGLELVLLIQSKQGMLHNFTQKCRNEAYL